jgi:hypothetical protein
MARKTTKKIAAPTFDLTANELAASLILVGECLNGMGGSRPADLEHDEYTWCDIDVLVKSGWSKEAAAGTFSSLDEKGVISEADTDQIAMTTAAWRYLDIIWDDRDALIFAGAPTASKVKTAKAAKAKTAAKTKAVDTTGVKNGIRAPKADSLCGKAWALFDKLGNSVTVSEALAAGAKASLNAGNITTELYRWRKHHGIVSKRAKAA